MENKKNVFERLQDVRVDLQKMNIKKDAENNFTKFNYYTLNAILPPINELCQKHRITYTTKFTKEEVTLTLYNQDDLNDTVVFGMPFVMSELKSAPRIQCLGASVSYITRYLMISVFGIAESDFYDSLPEDKLQEIKPVNETEENKKDELIKFIIKNKENEKLKESLKEVLKKEQAKNIKELSLSALETVINSMK